MCIFASLFDLCLLSRIMILDLRGITGKGLDLRGLQIKVSGPQTTEIDEVTTTTKILCI